MPALALKVNQQSISAEVEGRTLLSELLREYLGLTGTHIGCDTSQCGACVVHLDGRSVKACTVLALQADGREVLTIEGLAPNGLAPNGSEPSALVSDASSANGSSANGSDGSGERLHPMQEAFREYHGLQCGFCTPGMIMSAIELLEQKPNPSEQEVRTGLSGNFCRCTGYHNIVRAVMSLARSS